MTLPAKVYYTIETQAFTLWVVDEFPTDYMEIKINQKLCVDDAVKLADAIQHAQKLIPWSRR